MKMSLPWTYYRISNADYEYKESDTTIELYDSNDNLIISKDAYEMGFGNEYMCFGNSHGYKPVFYKGNLFFERNYGVYLVNYDTFKLERQFSYLYDYSSYGLCPYELEQKTLFESKNGFELYQGNFIRNIGYCTPNTMYTFYPRCMYVYDETDSIGYSCDGIYYMNIANPLQDEGRIVHAMLNGEDCICITDNVTAYAYKTEDLRRCWENYTSESPYVYFNGVRLAFDTPPVIENGSTLMPLRYLLESAGAAVDWLEETRTAVISYGGIKIEITDSSDTAYINGREFALGVCARILDDKMMIPLRFVSEGLGFSVEWDQNRNSVYISTSIDNINTFVSLMSPIEFSSGVMLNGEAVECVAAGGRTFVPVYALKKYFSLSRDSSIEYSDYELELLAEKDESFDISKLKYYCKSADMVCIHRSPVNAYINGVSVPVYTTRTNADSIETENDTNLMFPGFICIEEAADKTDLFHYEWIDEEDKLYIYVSDNMVRFDEALKAVLDAKGISCDEEYDGGYFKDIDYAQQYSSNNISALVCAGVKAGAVKEEDYPAGLLRPSRTISHLDLDRMLSGIGVRYVYDEELKNVPVTAEEFAETIREL